MKLSKEQRISCEIIEHLTNSHIKDKIVGAVTQTPIHPYPPGSDPQIIIFELDDGTVIQITVERKN